MGINPAKSIGHVATAAGKGLKQTAKAVGGGVSRAGKKGLFGGFCGRDSGIGPAQRAKTTIWN